MSGCAKTTTAMSSIVNLPLSKWICIAFTHSAVNNLKSIFMKLSKLEIIPQNNFMTIHKFLQIPVNQDNYTVIKRRHLKYLADLVIVDEFSLVPLDIIEYLFELSVSADVNFVFVGDFVQLMPISITREPISLNLLSSDFSNINLTFNEAIRIADHLSNSVYTSKYFEKAEKMILLHNYRNGSRVNQVLNDALDYKFNKAMGAADDYIISLSEIPKYIREGYIILSSMYSLLERAYMYTNPYVSERNGIQFQNELRNTRIGKIKMSEGDRLVLIENLDGEYVNGDEVFVKSLLDDNDVEIFKKSSDQIKDDKMQNDKIEGSENIHDKIENIPDKTEKTLFQIPDKLETSDEIKTKNTRIVNATKLLPYNFITCHKAQGRTIPKVLLILDDLFEITMLYTAITRARDDVKFIKFKHLPNKTDIDAFKIMRDVIYFSEKKNEVKPKVKPKRMNEFENKKVKNILDIDYSHIVMNANVNVNSADCVRQNMNENDVKVGDSMDALHHEIINLPKIIKLNQSALFQKTQTTESKPQSLQLQSKSESKPQSLQLKSESSQTQQQSLQIDYTQVKFTF